MDKEEQRMARIRGELENFAQDTVEYFQKTALVFPPNLENYAKRIAELGYRKIEGEPPLLSVVKMQGIAANTDDQGDHRYSHLEVRKILKEQRDLMIKWYKGEKCKQRT